MFVFVLYCVGSGPCDELITRSEESYRVCVSNCVYDLESSTVQRPRPELGFCATEKNLRVDFSYCVPLQGLGSKFCTHFTPLCLFLPWHFQLFGYQTNLYKIL